MRSLRFQVLPPFIPHSDPFAIHNINMAAVAADDHAQQPQPNSDHAPLNPQQSNLNILVRMLPSSILPHIREAHLPPPSQVSQNGSRPPSANGAPPAADQAQNVPASPTAQAQMSIASLLAGARNGPGQDSHQGVWGVGEVPGSRNGEQLANGQVSLHVWALTGYRRRELTWRMHPLCAFNQPSSSKRRLEDADDEDPHSKIRRTVQQHVQQGPERLMNMTTVACLHAAVAQKSYGSEKRFLCPPPLVRIEGPFGHIRDQQLSMSIVSETGERAPEQRAPLDSNMTASFKFLHVTGTAKAKSFLLSLEIAQPGGELAEGGTRTRPWATFESAPVTIISKPSKKTAKTRNIQSCILAGGPVSLFNRINSQTVRTKYMTIDHAHLCASNVSWSAFNVNVLRRPQDQNPLGDCEVTVSMSLSLFSDHQYSWPTAGHVRLGDSAVGLYVRNCNCAAHHPESGQGQNLE